MKQITYRQVEAQSHNCSVTLMQLGEEIKGEIWPLFISGAKAAIIQLDDTVFCMSVLEKQNYFSATEQLDELIDNYSGLPEFKIKKVIAAGTVRIFTLGTVILVTVGGVEIVSLYTYPIQTNLIISHKTEEGSCEYYLDLMHQELLSSTIGKEGHASLVCAMLSLRSLIGK